MVSLVVQYLETIRYWEDEDSGHWEETRKVAASSIGPVVAALREWIQLLTFRQADSKVGATNKVVMTLKLDQLEQLRAYGQDALSGILPSECIQAEKSKSRRFDGALVFLCYPLAIVDRETVDQILGDVAEHLTGRFGIRRYPGDSYWCANYRDLLAADQRSSDFSDDLSARDQLLQRSSSQLTTRVHPSGPFRCPESYFLNHGEWVPNDLTPLLWTQANLMQAFGWLKNSLALLTRQ